jgi:hypothetical protein
MPQKTDTPRETETPSSSTETSPHSRQSSRHNAHVPLNPSQLREVYAPSERSASPETAMRPSPTHNDGSQPQSPSVLDEIGFSTDRIQPLPEHTSILSDDNAVLTEEPRGILETEVEPSARSRLLNHQNWDAGSCCGSENCNHGAMSPRPWSVRSYGTVSSNMSRTGFGGPYPGTPGSSDPAQALLGEGVGRKLPGKKKRSTTKYLAERHGVKNQTLMYVFTRRLECVIC